MTPLEQKCVEIFKLISPKDLENISYKRYGCDNDGGYIMIENEVKGGLAYSFGIGGNVSWDIEMANHGYTIYQYDHTIENTPVQNKNFIFNKKGISNKIDGKLTTIEDIILKNKHQDETDIILKCDIEGCEWDAFYQIKDNVLNCFSNILIEFHWFNALADDDVFYHKVHNVLEKLSQMFVPYHIHANNFSKKSISVNGKVVPAVLELSYVKKNKYKVKYDSNRTFPTSIDMPNSTKKKDWNLGNFQW
jgi:hypothetical protein